MPDIITNRLPVSRPASGPRGLMNGLLRAGSVEGFRAAAPLPADSQMLVDQAVLRVQRQRLVIVDDLINAGLTRPLPNWLGVLELGWDSANEVGHAQRTMIPKARGERQVMDRERNVIPIYCTWDDFSFGIRELLSAERNGLPLDTAHIEQATRRVNEAIEDQCINGAGFTVKGNGAPGLLNSTNVNTYPYIDAEAWTASGHSGEDIVADVMNMAALADADGYPGPYNLYIPSAYGFKLGQDYKAAASTTIRERLLELDFIDNIRVAPSLPANRTALIQMTSDVIDVIVGQQPTPVSWEDGPGWERFFVVLACVIVRIRSNYEGQSGIVIGNLTV